MARSIESSFGNRDIVLQCMPTSNSRDKPRITAQEPRDTFTPNLSCTLLKGVNIQIHQINQPLWAAKAIVEREKKIAAPQKVPCSNSGGMQVTLVSWFSIQHSHSWDKLPTSPGWTQNRRTYCWWFRNAKANHRLDGAKTLKIMGNHYLSLNWWVDPGFLVAINTVGPSRFQAEIFVAERIRWDP